MTPGRREALLLCTAGIAAAGAGFFAGPLLLRLGDGDSASQGQEAVRWPLGKDEATLGSQAVNLLPDAGVFVGD